MGGGGGACGACGGGRGSHGVSHGVVSHGGSQCSHGASWGLHAEAAIGVHPFGGRRAPCAGSWAAGEAHVRGRRDQPRSVEKNPPPRRRSRLGGLKPRPLCKPYALLCCRRRCPLPPPPLSLAAARAVATHAVVAALVCTLPPCLLAPWRWWYDGRMKRLAEEALPLDQVIKYHAQRLRVARVLGLEERLQRLRVLATPARPATARSPLAALAAALATAGGTAAGTAAAKRARRIRMLARRGRGERHEPPGHVPSGGRTPPGREGVIG